MKQFLTLCMATAMIGSAAASPKVTLREAMQLKSEGKAQLVQGMSRANGVKMLKNKPVSAFHKIQADKAEKALKVQQRAMANGDAIYGNLVYTNTDTAEPGYYELNGADGTFLWTNDFAAAGATLSYDAEDECLKGYYPDVFWGMLFGVYYVEMDPETGAVTKFEEQDMNEVDGYMQVAALDNEGYFYGFGACNGVGGLVKAPAEDPFAYELVAGDIAFCNGFCYNQTKGVFFGVDNNGMMIEITKAGEITECGDVYTAVPDFYPYLGGLVYDGNSNRYYWNGQKEASSGMYEIDPATYAITLIADCADGEEYMSLVTTDVKAVEGMPNAPVANFASFPKGAMMGTVNFTLPTTLKDETKIEGRVKYNAYLNGRLYTTGSQQAGAEVTIPYFCDEAGTNTFALSVVVNGIESKKASIRCWVGNDYPLNPTDVVLTAESLTWNAVPTGEGAGVHAGYVEPGKVTYTVLINGEVKAEGLTECKFNPGFDTEATIESYSAEVIAVCNGLESTSSESNNVLVGEPYTVPASFEPTPEEFAVSTIYDGNGSYGYTLNQGNEGYYIQCGYTSSIDIPMDAWYFLPPVAIDDVTKFYSLSVDVARRSTNYEEEFEVVVCNEPTPNGVVETAIDYTVPEYTSYETFEGTFRVRQAGTYYVALHCTSIGDQLGIKARNFVIADNNITLQSPAQAEYLSAEETAKGELSALVDFQFPTKDLAGNALAADAELTATVASAVDAIEVAGTPGAKVAGVKVMTVQNTNVISVTVTNAEGLNSPRATTEVYTGVTVPATPMNVEANASRDNMSLILTWDPVTTPDDPEGIIDPSDVQYVIYQYVQTLFGSSWQAYDIVDGTSYEYTLPEGSAQDNVPLGVGAINAAGTNGYLRYGQVVIGTPYELPFAEDFNPEGFTTQPWMIYNLQGAGEVNWGAYEMSAIDEEATEGGFLGALGEAGSAGLLSMPKICTFSNNETIRVTFDICADYDLPYMEVLGQTYGATDKYIPCGVLTVEEGEGWKQAYIDIPAELMNKFWVELFLYVEFPTGDELLAISNITADCPTGVAGVAASEGIKISAAKNAIEVSGLSGQNVVVSTLDGKVAAKQFNAKNNATFNLEKGVYVVKAGEKNAKVVVK